MDTRMDDEGSGMSLTGLAFGLGLGLVAGFLAAPMRGTEMRELVRSRALQAWARLEGFAASRGWWPEEPTAEDREMIAERRAASRHPAQLTATLGELAQMHINDDRTVTGAQS